MQYRWVYQYEGTGQYCFDIRKGKKKKVVYLGREYEDGYVENKENKDNNPSDKKLKRLGFEYHFTTETGMERTDKFLKETEIWKDWRTIIQSQSRF